MYKYTFYSEYRSAEVETSHPIPLGVGQNISLDFPMQRMEGIYEIKKIRPGLSVRGVDFYVEVE